MSESTKQFRAEGDVDKLVHETFFPDHNRKGIIVDVGAARPDYLSVSAHYREHGWRVIAVEPNPNFCALYHERGLEVLQYACGDHDQDDVDFVVVNSHGSAYKDGQVTNESFSSLAIKDSYAKLNPHLDTTKIKVNLRRLDTILSEHAPDVSEFDILSVDVEGWELEVMAGLNVDNYRPRVLVLENLFNERKYRDALRPKNYLFWKRIPPNDVYVRADVIPGSIQRLCLKIREFFVNRSKK